MRRRQIAQPAYEPEYFSTLNTTPLIDVLLVLLVMIMLSLPMAMHKVPIDLPAPGASAGTPPPVHRLTIAKDGAFAWDGTPIADSQLTPRLRAHAADPKTPLLVFRADAQTRYDRVDATLAAIKRAGVMSMGFEGNHRWGRW